MEKKEEKNIIIAGVGGQGNILVSQIIAEAALTQGLDVIIGEIFGMSQRGGPVSSHVRIGKKVLGPVSPRHGAHIICGLEPMEALRVAIPYIRSDGLVLMNTRINQPIAVNMGKATYPPIEKILVTLESLCQEVISFDATALAIEAGGAVATNIVLLGALSAVKTLGLTVESYEKAIRQVVPKFLEMNLKAFHLGHKECLA